MNEAVVRAEALGKASAHHLELHRSHEHEADLAQVAVPRDAEHGVLLGELG